MRKFLQKLLRPLLTRLVSEASKPDKTEVHKSLSQLLESIIANSGKRGLLLNGDVFTDKFVIFSDHHKGNKDYGDDFANNEPNYLTALNYYLLHKFIYINLGDGEELWKYTPEQVISKNVTALRAEAKFQEDGKYYKTFGNHDIIWKNKPDVDKWFKDIFTLPLPVWEGILLKSHISGSPFSIFFTHGHQGDKMSDNNLLSTWMVAHIWRPVQRYLQVNVNTPARDYRLRDKHNIVMYEWSSHKKNLLLITGHTHKPVFASGKYSDHENHTIRQTLSDSKKVQLIPSYFNCGCCCYNDGDITGIEIAEGKISLIKWHLENNISVRIVLEEAPLTQIVSDLTD